ncbi:hypothetical protein JTE90_013523, partial [Oedothorax gibbosus]
LGSPTPPTDENDIYIDYSVGFWYEPSFMHEATLPPIYIKKEAKRQKMDPVVSGNQMKEHFSVFVYIILA